MGVCCLCWVHCQWEMAQRETVDEIAGTDRMREVMPGRLCSGGGSRTGDGGFCYFRSNLLPVARASFCRHFPTPSPSSHIPSSSNSSTKVFKLNSPFIAFPTISRYVIARGWNTSTDRVRLL